MIMSSRIISSIIAMSIISQWLVLTGNSLVGVNYGTLGDNLPAPQDAINSLKTNGITRVRLFDPNHSILDALRGSGIEVAVGTRNEDLPTLASSKQATDDWLTANILPYNDVSFKWISLGNEVIPGPYSQYVFPAMQNMQDSINAIGLGGRIMVTIVVPSVVLGTSYPPSQGTFAQDIVDIMKQIITFLTSNGSPLMVNVYPYFAYISDPVHISLDFALFKSTSPGFMDGDLAYYNLYDAQLDSFLAAIGRVNNNNNVSIIVSESGWPSAGNEPCTSIENAQTYNNNLKNHALLKGTPRRPDTLLDVFIFALFNENLKAAGAEQHFGNFYPSLEPVYPLWP